MALGSGTFFPRSVVGGSGLPGNRLRASPSSFRTVNEGSVGVTIARHRLFGNFSDTNSVSETSGIPTTTSSAFYLPTNENFVSRASSGTYFDNTGTLQIAPPNTARQTYNPSTLTSLGTLIEPAALNGVRNNTMAGAVAGVIGSGGVVPTNWSLQNTSGITVQIVGTGVEDGINYIDMAFSGTATSTSTFAVFTDTSSSIPATNGQNWTNSFFAKMISGSHPINSLIQWFNSSGVYIAGQAGSTGWTPTTAALSSQRFSSNTTLNTSGIYYVHGCITWPVVNGTSYNFTLRMGMPQLEQGLVPTSVIPTGNGLSQIRAADVYVPIASDSVAGNALFNSAVNEPYDIAPSPFYLSGNETFYSRNSSATYFDNTGTLQTGAANTARVNYNPSTLTSLGTLVEPASTNVITNNTMYNTSSPLGPANWDIGTGGLGLTFTIIGTGTESGIPYIDVQVSGTTTAAASVAWTFMPYTSIPASYGQTWSQSFFCKLTSGSLTNVTLQNGIEPRDINGNGLTQGLSTFTATTAGLATQQTTQTYTLPDATTAYIEPRIRFTVPTSTAINFTIRVGAPQLENQPYSTSLILTSGSAATRSADFFATSLASDATDAPNSIYTGVVGESNNQSTADTPSANATFSTAVAETGNATDATDAPNSIYIGAVSETGSTNDILNTTNSIYVGSVTESGTSVDSANGLFYSNSTITEIGNASDAVDASNSVYNGATAESVSATDTGTTANSSFVGAITENGNSSDSATVSAMFVSSVVDDANAADSTDTLDSIFNVDVVDVESSSDSVACSFAALGMVDETGLADDFTLSTSIFSASISEIENTADSTYVGPSIWETNTEDTNTVVDSAMEMADEVGIIVEGVSASETTDTDGSVFAGSISENGSAEDAIVGAFSYVGYIVESEVSFDSVYVSSVFLCDTSEICSVTDEADSSGSVFGGNVVENGVLVDQSDTNSSVFLGNSTESENTLDTVSAIAEFTITVLDGGSLADSGDTFGSIYGGNVADNGLAVDATSAADSYAVSVAETLGGTLTIYDIEMWDFCNSVDLTDSYINPGSNVIDICFAGDTTDCTQQTSGGMPTMSGGSTMAGGGTIGGSRRKVSRDEPNTTQAQDDEEKKDIVINVTINGFTTSYKADRPLASRRPDVSADGFTTNSDRPAVRLRGDIVNHKPIIKLLNSNKRDK